MMKRIRWFVAGAITSVAAGRVGKRKLQQAVERNAPAAVAKRQLDATRHRVSGALREGRQAMRDKEAELRRGRRAG